MKKIIFLASILLLLGSCGNESDFLFLTEDRDPPPPLPVAEEILEEFNISQVGGTDKVDVVWVVDNSGSMHNIQQNIIRNAELFIKQFTGSAVANWRMGILSSDTSESPYLGFGTGAYFDRNTKNPVRVFNNAFSQLGTSGDITEKFFDPVQIAFNRDPNFVRPGAFLVFIFVTDELEQSTVLSSSSSFLQYATQLKGDRTELIKAYGAFNYGDLGCSSSDSYRGGRFQPLIEQTGGGYFKACSEKFGSDLARVGQSIVALLRPPKVLLSQRPKLETLKVMYKDQVLPFGPSSEGGAWYYDEKNNVVVFYNLSFVPEGEEPNVTILYDEDNGY